MRVPRGAPADKSTASPDRRTRWATRGRSSPSGPLLHRTRGIFPNGPGTVHASTDHRAALGETRSPRHEMLLALGTIGIPWLRPLSFMKLDPNSSELDSSESRVENVPQEVG